VVYKKNHHGERTDFPDRAIRSFSVYVYLYVFVFISSRMYRFLWIITCLVVFLTVIAGGGKPTLSRSDIQAEGKVRLFSLCALINPLSVNYIKTEKPKRALVIVKFSE
jgi:hypothetical protein